MHASPSSETCLVVPCRVVLSRFAMRRNSDSDDEYVSGSGKKKSKGSSSKVEEVQVIPFEQLVGKFCQAVTSTRGASPEDFVVFTATEKVFPPQVLVLKPFFETYFNWPTHATDSSVLSQLSQGLQ